ncbi:MAG: hypothetical protein LBC99_00780 [Spirochaetota bacterium]|jgi:hypothetical protein|nr:hypothetical protein [Spirochaetota bacterium]
MKRVLLAAFLFILAVFPVYAASSLLFLELQGVVGYSVTEDDFVLHSGHAHDTMQKNGIGFDFIQKFSGESGDVGMGALQMRLVWDDAEKRIQPQVYNAYLKFKIGGGDIWAGHNRIAFGAVSYWDTHADLLQPLSMQGFGFDRDWGIGYSYDFADGDLGIAISTGSGMGLKFRGNWLATSRFSLGILDQDNYTIGFSCMGGRIPDVMGYVITGDPVPILIGGLDFAWNHGRFGHKAEFDCGTRADTFALAALYRLSYNLLEEDRLKLEVQGVYASREGMEDLFLAGGVTFRITADLAARVMYQAELIMGDQSLVLQIYWYFGV